MTDLSPAVRAFSAFDRFVWCKAEARQHQDAGDITTNGRDT